VKSARHVRKWLRLEFAAIAAGVLLPVLPLSLHAEEDADHRCNVIVVAFVGGIGTAHFPPSVAVPLVHHLQSLHYPGVCVREFSAYCPGCAHHWVRKQFAGGRRRPLTEEQLKNGPGVILYGYSLGAPSELYVAQKLERDGIPVELAITVDSKGPTRGIIPRNVKIAANFYKVSFFRLTSGKRNMRLEDPGATDFLGNIRVTHVGHLSIAKSAPVEQLLLSTTRTLVDKRGDLAAVLGQDD
jgi:hypothetical protein